MVEAVHSVAKMEQQTKIAVQMEAKESIVAQMVKMSRDVHHQQELP